MQTEPMTTRSLIRIRASASLEDAARLMCDMSMGAVGIDDDSQHFVGLVTERDLLWAMAQGKNPGGTTVSEVVNDFPIVVDGPITSEEAADRMSSAHVRHLLVKEHYRLGIASLRDVVKGLLSDGSNPPSASSAEMRRMFGKAFARFPRRP